LAIEAKPELKKLRVLSIGERRRYNLRAYPTLHSVDQSIRRHTHSSPILLPLQVIMKPFSCQTTTDQVATLVTEESSGRIKRIS
jgi:hypothetical protein